MTTHRGTRLTAAIALVAGVPVAVWGLMGKQDATGVPASELDYAFRPFDVSEGLATVLGAIGLLLAGVGVAVLVRASQRRELDRRWWEVLAPLVMAGAIVGAGWRIATAGVIGANIGAGLAVLVGGPIVAALVLWALGRGMWLATDRNGGDGGRGKRTGFAPRSA